MSYASEDDVVFDPFLGSGTVLFECSLLGMEASGTEINPAAVAFSKIYELVNNKPEDILVSVNEIDKIIKLYECMNDIEVINLKNDLLLNYNQTSNPITKIILFAFITGMDFDIKKTNIKRIKTVWNNLCKNISLLPYSKKTIKSFECDGRSTTVKSASVDFVITSPPYINVFNYHQNYRKSIESMGIDVLKVAKSEIGANRKFRQNRFLTVVQYCMDLYQILLELRRICKKDAKIIFIVGRESKIKNTSFRNADLIVNIAISLSLKLEGKQERVFKNKFGILIFEEILKFSILDKEIDTLEQSRKIGQNALKKALNYADREVLDEISDAIIKSEKIQPSPILNT